MPLVSQDDILNRPADQSTDKPEQPSVPQTSTTGALITGYGHGSMLGMDAPVAGVASALFGLLDSDNHKGLKENYVEGRDANKEDNAEAERDHPLAYGAGNVAGSIPAYAAGAGAGARLGAAGADALASKDIINAGGTFSKLLRAAGSVGGQSAVGAAQGDAEGTGAGTGAALAAAGGGLGEVAGPVLAKLARTQAVGQALAGMGDAAGKEGDSMLESIKNSFLGRHIAGSVVGGIAGSKGDNPWVDVPVGAATGAVIENAGRAAMPLAAKAAVALTKAAGKEGPQTIWTRQFANGSENVAINKPFGVDKIESGAARIGSGTGAMFGDLADYLGSPTPETQDDERTRQFMEQSMNPAAREANSN